MRAPAGSTRKTSGFRMASGSCIATVTLNQEPNFEPAPLDNPLQSTAPWPSCNRSLDSSPHPLPPAFALFGLEKGRDLSLGLRGCLREPLTELATPFPWPATLPILFYGMGISKGPRKWLLSFPTFAVASFPFIWLWVKNRYPT